MELVFSKSTISRNLKEYDELIQISPDPIPIIKAAFNAITTRLYKLEHTLRLWRVNAVSTAHRDMHLYM